MALKRHLVPDFGHFHFCFIKQSAEIASKMTLLRFSDIQAQETRPRVIAFKPRSRPHGHNVTWARSQSPLWGDKEVGHNDGSIFVGGKWCASLGTNAGGS